MWTREPVEGGVGLGKWARILFHPMFVYSKMLDFCGEFKYG